MFAATEPNRSNHSQPQKISTCGDEGKEMNHEEHEEHEEQKRELSALRISFPLCSLCPQWLKIYQGDPTCNSNPDQKNFCAFLRLKISSSPVEVFLL
jgi:hypothetical protein